MGSSPVERRSEKIEGGDFVGETRGAEPGCLLRFRFPDDRVVESTSRVASSDSSTKTRLSGSHGLFERGMPEGDGFAIQFWSLLPISPLFLNFPLLSL